MFYFFYRTYAAFLLGVPCAIFFCGWRKRRLCERRQDCLREQFKDWIKAAASELQAGGGAENAFVRAGREMRLLYSEDSDIRMEIKRMERLLDNHVTLEKILEDFADRSGVEEICGFADAFAAGKRMGGDLREMIENCCGIVVMKTDTEREIRTLLHGRRTEQRIMCLVPFAIVGYIGISSPGYFAPLYHNPAGICIMTICLLLYLFAVYVGMRIVDVRI